MYRYTAYGLYIQSELALPELTPADVDTEPDVIINWARTDKSSIADIHPAETFEMQTPAGNYEINVKRGIVVEAASDVEEALIRTFLLGPVLSVLLRLRGLLVLHASGVAADDGVVIFLGNSGWGKSTLAEAFYAKGYSLVADDIIAIQMEEDKPIVLPGFPQAKLWPDAAASLGFSPQQLPKLHQQTPKHAHRLHAGFAQVSLPLKKVYILGPVSAQHQIHPLELREAFVQLVRFSRAMVIPNRSDLNGVHFQQCTTLIGQVPVALLKRQSSLEALPDLVSLIENDAVLKQPQVFKS